MAYIDPRTVDAPKTHWRLGRVLINHGDGAWSLAKGTWDGDEVYVKHYQKQ